MLSRRGMFGIMGGGLLATSAPAALFWHQSPLNTNYIVSELLKRLESDSMSTEERDAHKNWPEFGTHSRHAFRDTISYRVGPGVCSTT